MVARILGPYRPILTRAHAPRQVGSKAVADCKCNAGYYDADGSGEDDSVTVRAHPPCQASFAFPAENRFCTPLLYGRAGR